MGLAPRGRCDRCGDEGPEYRAALEAAQASQQGRRGHLRAVDGHQADPDPSDEVILAAIPEYPVGDLRGPLREFVVWAVADGLPAAAAGAAGLAALAAVAGPAELLLTSTLAVRPALWIVPIGGTGTGKSPALIQAFREVERLYAVERERWDENEKMAGQEGAQVERYERPESLVNKDVTLPSVARWLKANGGAGTLLYDELEALLADLGGKDRAKLCEAWTARTSMHIQRVGDGGSVNAVDIYVPRPVLSVIGPLTPDNTLLLGREGNGFRARWLPHIVSQRAELLNGGPQPDAWRAVVGVLYGNRETRTWKLEGAGRLLYEKSVQRWTAEQDEPYPQSVIEALRKAGMQCARIALVVAESLDPGGSGNIPVAAVKSAIAITDYSLGCWKALPGGSVLTLSMTDEKLTTATDELLAWLEGRPAGTEGLPEGSIPRPRASRRDIQQAKVGGAVKPNLLHLMITEYANRYPGCVVTVEQTGGKGGGRPRQFVYFPRRDGGGGGGIGVESTPIRGTLPPGADQETARQGVAVSPRIGVESFNTDPFNTDISTPIRAVDDPEPTPADRCHTDPVTPIPADPDDPADPGEAGLDDDPSGWGPGTIGAAENPARRVRCPACRWQDRTVVPSGGKVTCKRCATTFTA